MGRRRAFDPEAALEAAMEVFWRKGYPNTSVDDLLAAMGINRWSLYETFGDKPQLFLKALGLYRARWSRFIYENLQAHASPRAALMALFRAMGRQIVDDKLGRGCLLANSAFEVAHLEPEARALVLEGLRGLEDQLTEVVERAQRAGEVSPQNDARTLARFLISAVNGIRSAGKLKAQRAPVPDLIELALSVLH